MGKGREEGLQVDVNLWWSCCHFSSFPILRSFVLQNNSTGKDTSNLSFSFHQFSRKVSTAVISFFSHNFFNTVPIHIKENKGAPICSAVQWPQLDVCWCFFFVGDKSFLSLVVSRKGFLCKKWWLVVVLQGSISCLANIGGYNLFWIVGRIRRIAATSCAPEATSIKKFTATSNPISLDATFPTNLLSSALMSDLIQFLSPA